MSCRLCGTHQQLRSVPAQDLCSSTGHRVQPHRGPGCKAPRVFPSHRCHLPRVLLIAGVARPVPCLPCFALRSSHTCQQLLHRGVGLAEAGVLGEGRGGDGWFLSHTAHVNSLLLTQGEPWGVGCGGHGWLRCVTGAVGCGVNLSAPWKWVPSGSPWLFVCVGVQASGVCHASSSKSSRLLLPELTGGCVSCASRKVGPQRLRTREQDAECAASGQSGCCSGSSPEAAIIQRWPCGPRGAGVGGRLVMCQESHGAGQQRCVVTYARLVAPLHQDGCALSSNAPSLASLHVSPTAASV